VGPGATEEKFDLRANGYHWSTILYDREKTLVYQRVGRSGYEQLVVFLITAGTQAGGTPEQSSAKLERTDHSARILSVPAGPIGLSTGFRCGIGQSCRILMRKKPTGPEPKTMLVDRYDPIDSIESVPKLKLAFEPELAQLDEPLRDGTRVVSRLLRGANRELSADSSRLGTESFRTTFESV
jgi:hypothetical protein